MTKPPYIESGHSGHSSAELYNMSQYVWSNKDIKVLGVTIAHEDIIPKNYENIVEKAKSILLAWQNRGLSLIGKIQVVNTLISSLFVYKMMVLPRIPGRIIKNLDNLIREYLWNGGKSKIALDILQLPKKEGGLNLVNFKRKETSLKATWPQILANEKDYSVMVYKLMRCSEIGANIWRCSLHPQDVGSLKIRNEFWQDVLECWGEYNYYKNPRWENQLIWYNSRIKIGGKPFFWRNVYQQGLVFIHQLFEKGKMKTFDKLKSEFGLNQLRTNSLKTAIPKDFKQFFCSLTQTIFSANPPP